MKSLRLVLPLAAVVLLQACVPERRVEPQQPQRPTPPARPAPPPPPPAAEWQDLPLSVGGWTYRSDASGSQALFGPPATEASFVVRCDTQRRQIVISRQGVTTGNMMTIRTSFGARNFPLSVQTQPLPYVYSPVPMNDAFLDSMAFSRGRFSVEVPGTPMLVIPSWPEPARVIEDCRS